MALPSLTGEEGICPVLGDVIGDISGSDRWQHFLGQNSRTAREFNAAWGALRLEAASCTTFLEKEFVGPLSAPVSGAGGDSVDGTMRRLVTQQREALRHEVISLAL